MHENYVGNMLSQQYMSQQHEWHCSGVLLTWEASLQHSWTSAMELFCKDSQQPKAKIFNWVN